MQNIAAAIAAFIALALVSQLMDPVGIVLAGTFATNIVQVRNIQAGTNIIIAILACLAARSTYRFFRRRPSKS